jgi:hypothetical protein
MGRQDDMLFCKIAVTNGLVTEEQAQKCLALCNRREQEGKRRPLVGAVFTKYDILKHQEVQRVYEAVNKRLGRTARPRQVGEVRPARGGAKERAAGPARRGLGGRADRRPRRVDPKTLAMGVGFGVVFIGVIVAMVVIFMTSGQQRVQEELAAGSGQAAPASSTAPLQSSLTAALALAEPETQAKMDQGFLKELKQMLSDANRQAAIEDDPAGALKLLETFLERSKGNYITPDMSAEVDRTRKDLAERASGAAATPVEDDPLEEP